jgi:hypothetical protein
MTSNILLRPPVAANYTSNSLLRPPVAANYDMQHTTPALRRGRFIVPTADLSARIRITRIAPPCPPEPQRRVSPAAPRAGSHPYPPSPQPSVVGFSSLDAYYRRFIGPPGILPYPHYFVPVHYRPTLHTLMSALHSLKENTYGLYHGWSGCRNI